MKQSITLLLFVVIAATGQASITLPSIFTDNMVLQQNASAAIWGWADEGVDVEVITSWDDQSYRGSPGKDGKWVGNRLAFMALGETYKMKGFSWQSPRFNEMAIEGSTVTISFHSDMGITAHGKEVKTFEIAGENKRFYPAKVQVRSKSVVLSSPQVKEPVAVRYAFDDFVEGQIFNNAGLPLSSFRTDDW